jgi:hypothetical protein
MKFARHTFLIAVLLLASSCGKAPVTLSPAGIQDYRANQAVIAVGTLQRTAIALNAVQVCEPACRPLLSDQNTRTVIDAVEVSLKTIQAVPSGWRVAADTALSEISGKLDARGLATLQPYVTAARTVLASL